MEANFKSWGVWFVCVNFVLYNPRTKERRRVITCSKNNGIIALEKHVDAYHAALAKRFEEEVKFPLRNLLERQPTKEAKYV
jgi:hypothetical protein